MGQNATTLVVRSSESAQLIATSTKKAAQSLMLEAFPAVAEPFWYPTRRLNRSSSDK
ncbi:hypothetical protein [Paraburkholderia tagetis]|uniref:Uncharacterized protein n=1 Tax=Paraburkholderia tagetis TaxID=2913261 RepID=A0A9X1RSN5_9BURK|nr:hypothetical protein [Paraburkholderia tagetis]MCG5076665.1 hypothetical protein [Paraburkholderia tagetis]